MSSNNDVEVFRGKASAYVLDDLTKQWNDRGTSGTVIMYDRSPHNNSINTNIATIKWVKNTHEVWWTLNGSKLKPKGERACVMKATLLKPNTKEILALRFKTSAVAKQFVSKYHEIFSNSAFNMYPSRPYYRPPGPPPQIPINTWQCQMCTLWNADSHSTCAACSSPKTITDAEPNIDAFYEDEKKWKCAVCTYTNSMDRQRCDMCGLPQDNYSTRIVTRYNHTRVEYQQQILDQETETRLTVSGYCRNIEQLLNANILNKQDVIIPSGVIHLCFMFYVNTPWDFILHILSYKLIHMGVQSWVRKEHFKLLCKLKKIAEYLLNVEKYRILPFNNNKFGNEILRYEGSLLFLHNLGFLLDTKTKDRLICQQVRPNVIESCIQTLTEKCKELKEAIDTNTNTNTNTVQNINQNQVTTATWICQTCTYQNNDFLSRCDACNSYKQLTIPLPNPYPPNNFINDANIWVCHICTYGNDVSVERCAACDSTKKRSSNQLEYQSKIQYPSIEDFENAASDIFYANSEPLSLFNALQSVTQKLRRDDDKFRKLDLTNEKVLKLLYFEGIEEFLMLLGFETGPIAAFLICNDKPQVHVLNDAHAIILKYQMKLKVFKSKVNHDDIKNSNDNIDEIKEEYDGKLTLYKLIQHGTGAEATDNDVMDMLVLTHKLFTTSLRFMKELRKRFSVNIPNNDDEKGQDMKNVLNARKRIHLKTIKTLKDWMKNYWVEDFIDNEELQKELNDWLKHMLIFQQMDEYNKDCDWVIKCHDAIKRVLKTLKNKTFCNEEKNAELDLSSMDKKQIRMLNNCSGEELADQITLMQEELFNKIKAREWLHSSRITNNYKHAPHLQKVTERNTMLTYFVISKILNENNLKNRAKIIKRFIRVGEQLKDVHNYQSLGAVFGALNNSCIHRLKRAWSRVPDIWKHRFDQWKFLFDKNNNYKNMKYTMRRGNKPCIPYVNMLINYFFVSQPSYKNNDINECYNDPSVLKERDVIMYIKQTDKIKQIQQDQKIRYDSLIKPNIALQTVLLNEFAKCNVFDEDTLWDVSTGIKKKDDIEYSKPVIF